MKTIFCDIRNICNFEHGYLKARSKILLHLLYENRHPDSLWCLRRDFIHVIHIESVCESEILENIFKKERKLLKVSLNSSKW